MWLPKRIPALVAGLFLWQLALAAETEHDRHDHPKTREECPTCGMFIDQYERTAAELTTTEGEVIHSCGVACLVRMINDHGASRFSSLKVKDWNTGELFPAEDAYYSIGSGLIPDMIPNAIAFKTREEAEEFSRKEGGEVINFNRVTELIAPRGTTAPARLNTAVTPAAGQLGIAAVFGYLERDQVGYGTESQDPTSFILSRRGQARVPREVDVFTEALAVNYSIRDDLAVFALLPYSQRHATALRRNLASNDIDVIGPTAVQADPTDKGISSSNGLGDLDLRLRYNVWRSTYFDKWFTVLLGTTLPTGESDPAFFGAPPDLPAAQRAALSQYAPPLFQGQGTATFTGGLLYSQRVGDFWVHSQATYRVNPPNDDGVALGDSFNGSIALHYNPRYRWLVGVEFDATHEDRSARDGAIYGNSGGDRLNLTFVGDYNVFNGLGGNFFLRGAVGLPVYEDLNVGRVAPNPFGGSLPVQSGGGYFVNLTLQFNTRLIN